MDQNDNKSVLVKVMTCHRAGCKRLLESMAISLIDAYMRRGASTSQYSLLRDECRVIVMSNYLSLHNNIIIMHAMAS